MKLTKYEHACFVVEKDGVSIVVDPGSLTTDLSMPDHVVAIIVTHEHADHFDPEHIAAIVNSHPAATVIGPNSVTSQLGSYNTRTVHGGDNFTIEGIELEFFGDTHAPIHPSRPAIENIGVLIDERIYYPGDSFTVPEKSVDVLALPVGAPWLKISEAMDFLAAVGPRLAFPTHDAVLSRDGQGFADGNVKSFADAEGIEYTRIDGETIEIE